MYIAQRTRLDYAIFIITHVRMHEMNKTIIDVQFNENMNKES